MSIQIRKTFTTLLLAAGLAGATLPAQAQDDVSDITAIMAAQVGRIIAMQGNAALESIQRDFSHTIEQGWQLLPVETQKPEARAIKTSAELDESVTDALACPSI